MIRRTVRVPGVALLVALTACQPAPTVDPALVQSSDPALREAVAALLPGLVARSGLELREPIRVERRSRAELERFLVQQLDEELPPERARRLTRAYALLGMVPEDLDLRQLLLDVYTEQVAGFYDPEADALFVLDDQPAEALEPLLVHELVHALQDQTAPLDELTDPARGNDRQMAAQAAIEGHATLIMLEALTGRLRGGDVDLSEVPDVAALLRPALESVRTQYPSLGEAPEVIRASVLFPYLEGAGFVQALWSAEGGRTAPFGERLPASTEQVLAPADRFLAPGGPDAPTGLTVRVAGREAIYENGLGAAETRIFLGELGAPARAAVGWDGDAYALLSEDELAWAVVWDDAAAREAFLHAVEPRLGGLPRPARVEPRDVDGRPVSVLTVGDGLAPSEVTVELVSEGGA